MSVMEKKFYSEEILAKNFIADSQFLNNASIKEDAVNIIKLCRDRKKRRYGKRKWKRKGLAASIS